MRTLVQVVQCHHNICKKLALIAVAIIKLMDLVLRIIRHRNRPQQKQQFPLHQARDSQMVKWYTYNHTYSLFYAYFDFESFPQCFFFYRTINEKFKFFFDSNANRWNAIANNTYDSYSYIGCKHIISYQNNKRHPFVERWMQSNHPDFME